MTARTCATCPSRIRTPDRDHCIHCQRAGLDIPFAGRWVRGTWGVLVAAREEVA